MKRIIFYVLLSIPVAGFSQTKMTPETLWKLGRVTGLGISKDGKSALYSVKTYNTAENTSITETFVVPVTGGSSVQTFNKDSVMRDKNISPNGKYIIYDKEVKVKKVKGTDLYPELTKSNAYIYDDLNYRHWDKWSEGTFNH